MCGFFMEPEVTAYRRDGHENGGDDVGRVYDLHTDRAQFQDGDLPCGAMDRLWARSWGAISVICLESREELLAGTKGISMGLGLSAAA